MEKPFESTIEQGGTESAVSARFLQSSMRSLIAELIPSRQLRALAYIGFWTVVAFASALHWWFYPQGSYPYTWWQLFMGKAAVWYTWGLVAPLVFWFGHRFRLDAGPRLKHALLLMVLATVVTLVYLLTYTQWILWVTGASDVPGAFGDMLRFVISMHSTYYFLAFWGLIAIEHTVAYYRRFVERERQTAQLEKQLVHAQIERLRSQLHPHFLFNTLNTVSSLVLTEQNSQAYDALAELAELLRMSLDRNERQLVTLEEEIEFDRIYVGLMSRRFPGRLDVRWSIDAHANRALVPSMILQPLIENAVKYGVEGDSIRTKIEVRAHLANENLEIEIENSCQSGVQGNRPRGYGIGLGQTRQRLVAHYGERHIIESGRDDQNRFLVSLTIPFEKGTRSTSTVSRESGWTKGDDRR